MTPEGEGNHLDRLPTGCACAPRLLEGGQGGEPARTVLAELGIQNSTIGADPALAHHSAAWLQGLALRALPACLGVMFCTGRQSGTVRHGA